MEQTLSELTRLFGEVRPSNEICFKCVANWAFRQMGVHVAQQDPLIFSVEDTAKGVHEDTERA